MSTNTNTYTFDADVYEFYGMTLFDCVETYLDEHPEATTTVQDDSLTTAKYKDKSVTTVKLDDKAVTTDKLDDGAVTKVKLSTELQGKVDLIDTNAGNIDALDTRVDELQASVGTPLVASTVAGMTDHTKIYVYTGSETGYVSGNWYYWNGTAWTSGGVYNSTAFVTDTTLTLSGKAADAKVAGDKITDLKSALGAKTINFFPDAMQSDIGEYVDVTYTSTLDKRYNYEGALIEGNGYVAVTFNVNLYDKLYLTGASAGYSRVLAVHLMNGDSLVESLYGESYQADILIPFGVDNVRVTLIKSSYQNGSFICKRMEYESIANKNYAKNEAEKAYIRSAVPIEITVQEDKRYSIYGQLVDNATGYFAFQMNVVPGDVVTFMGAHIGSQQSTPIVLMCGDTFVSNITDSGIIGIGTKYTLTVPSGVDNLRVAGIKGEKHDYPVFKRIVLDDNCVSGNGYENGNQTTYIVGDGFMPTIQCACDFADADDIIFIKSGTYNEAVSIWNKKLHLVGEDVNTTFLVEHVGNYANPPLEMNIGSLSNITLIEDGTESESDPLPTQQRGAYCLHVEAINPTEEAFDVYNCRFINYCHAAVGIGLQKDYTIRFRNCVMETFETDEGVMERGALFCHVATTSNNPTNQHLIVENCIIHSADNFAVLLGRPTGATGGSGDYRFSGCTIWSANNGISDSAVRFDNSSQDATFDKVESYGNTIAVLNSNS